MKPGLRFLPEARCEFDDAIDWYDRQRRGLGIRFLDAVCDTIEDIRKDPARREVLYRNTRKEAVQRFPYIVLYQIDATEILVVSVFHTARDPVLWRSRV